MHRYDDDEPKDTIESRTNDLVMYLSHCGKTEMMATVMELSRRLAIAEREVHDSGRDKVNMQERLNEMAHFDGGRDRLQSIAIPHNARSVEVKF